MVQGGRLGGGWCSFVSVHKPRQREEKMDMTVEWCGSGEETESGEADRYYTLSNSSATKTGIIMSAPE